MASSDTRSARRLPKPLSEKPNHAPICAKRASDVAKSLEAKSLEKHQRRRPTSLAQPKRATNEVIPIPANRKTLRNAEEVNQVRNKGSSRSQSNGQAVIKTRREKVGIRGRRRVYHVADLPSRRRVLTYRAHPPTIDMQLRRHSLDNFTNQFPLLNLEDYLRQRSSEKKDVVQACEDMDSPKSHQVSINKPNWVMKNGRSVFDESLSQFADITLKDKSLLNKFSVRTYVSSADEADETINRIESDKSAYGISLRRSADNRMRKNDGLLYYAGSCFNVSRRRVAGGRNRVSYMYSSERSLSSLNSETEMAPLMTEPEPFHEFSDDESASSLEEHCTQFLGELTYDSYKEAHSHDRELLALGYKNVKTHETSSVVQALPIRRPKDISVKQRSISQKYRPKSFKDVLGQKMVVESLSNAILRSKIAPVYLFHGPRGTGKTTVAKIFTCAMNCLSIEELRPCGLCNECSSFNAGSNYDMKELDAAGNNELESMKHVLKHLSLPPSVSRYKVFIMDDCHMLTAEAWNALLKSLEEPPEYVVFILVTTDLEQLPRGAISRCQKFMFNRIKDADIVFRLRRLAEQENVDIDSDALHFIAAQSDGSLRDAETMLDQLSLLGKRVTLGIVREMVGLIPDEELINLLDMALSGDAVSTVSTIRKLMGSGVEPLALTSQLATVITDILADRCSVARYSGSVIVNKDQQDKLQEALRVLSDLEKQLRSCTDRTTWVTAAFLQLAGNSSCPGSSRSTSMPQSPKLLLGGADKDILNPSSTGRRCSWGGNERQGLHSALHTDGSYMDNRIYPCDNSPQSGVSMDDKAVCRLSDEASQDVQKCCTLSPCSMDVIWQKVLHESPSSVLKQLSEGDGKLVSISIVEGFAVAYLEFKSLERKSMAERDVQKISNAFQSALSCPVKVEISLSLPLQGRGSFACRGDDRFVQSSSGRSSKRMLFVNDVGYQQDRGPRGSSVRKSSASSSFRKEFSLSSPRCHELEHRKSVKDADGNVHACGTRSTETSVGDLQTYKGNRDIASNAVYQEENDNGYVSERSKHKEQRVSFEDPVYTGSLRWSDPREDMEYSSDSEIDGRYAPGLLCWKGTRIKDHRGKHHVLRRRRTRFFLRLVPCAAKEEEDPK
ncbi:hypothetical protein KP509_24G026300 [Ceratopteris richardii]|nr:hypothetical protein KP509_24G026300 [Ceratopteris richardii]